MKRFGVSVYIPSRNHAATLPVAIYSAARESPTDVIVIDDASGDASLPIARAAECVYPCVRVFANDKKAECWEQAAADRFSELRGSHVVSLSADDELIPGIVHSSMRFQSAAIIFHGYLVRDHHSAYPVGRIKMCDEIQVMTPSDVQARIASDASPCETGIGSAIRHDWLEWLCELEYWKMGPWADAIGYAAVAALGGAVYLPVDGAIFTINESGYGATIRNSPDAPRYMRECREFLFRTGIPQEVADSLCRKRGVNA